MPARPKTKPSGASARPTRRRNRQALPGYDLYGAPHKLLREIVRVVYEESALLDLLHVPDPETIARIHANGYLRTARLMGEPRRYA